MSKQDIDALRLATEVLDTRGWKATADEIRDLIGSIEAEMAENQVHEEYEAALEHIYGLDVAYARNGNIHLAILNLQRAMTAKKNLARKGDMV